MIINVNKFKNKSIDIEWSIMGIKVEGSNLVRVILDGFLKKVSFKVSLEYWRRGHMGKGILCRRNSKYKAPKWECIQNGWGFKKTISTMMNHWIMENEVWEAEDEMDKHWVLLLLFPFVWGSFQEMEVVLKFLSNDIGSLHTHTTHLGGSILHILYIQLVLTSGLHILPNTL